MVTLQVDVPALIVTLALTPHTSHRTPHPSHLTPHTSPSPSQNVLFFTALKHLDAATYSVLSQSKTAFTALFFVTILGKKLTSTQFGALAILMIGMGMVQLSQVTTVAPAVASVASAAVVPAIGCAAVLASSAASGFANIAFEKVAKTENGYVQLYTRVHTRVYVLTIVHTGVGVRTGSMQSLRPITSSFTKYNKM